MSFDPGIEKFILGNAVDFMLEIHGVLLPVVEGDYVTLIVFIALLRAGVAPVNAANQPRVEAVDGILPDTLRRPVSVLSISGFLGLPYETTRRHMLKLQQLGLCRRVGSREYLVTSDILSLPQFTVAASKTARRAGQFAEIIARLPPKTNDRPV